MENSLTNVFPEPFCFLFLYNILVWVITKFQKLLSSYISFLLSHTKPFTVSSLVYDDQKKNTPSEQESDLGLSREDMEAIIGRMSLSFTQEGEQLKENIGFDELSNLFEEEEPSFTEVKEAFSVFDENSDGFIDALDLQRVLPKLGFREGTDLHACKQMISAYDVNHDGRLDFIEFVKFLEISFC
ncbi:probable calcium-binding protein CML46 [Typha latifolia]|uniref:probable calcium-binding protein CML46 n=1 Tax=Typha latifolia TaxID=4733 RepID=UPI003C2BB3B5